MTDLTLFLSGLGLGIAITNLVYVVVHAVGVF